MEGQSEDCPDPCRGGRCRLGSSCRNGGAVGRLPGRQWDTSTPCAPAGRNGGAVGRLPGRSTVGSGTAAASRPQWRGSRKTARTRHHPSTQWRTMHAAMEGQSEDCPDQTRRSGRRRGNKAAMEGQSEDCPDKRSETGRTHEDQGRNGGAVGRLPGPGATRPDDMWFDGPQWRGSRKTARTPGTPAIRSPTGPAAMEGQSEDCPDQPAAPERPLGFRGRNGGAVGRLPGRRLSSLVATLSAPPQWRGSRKTARTSADGSFIPPARKPQWRGSRKTARTHGGQQPPTVGSVAAMEGQSEDCPDLPYPSAGVRHRVAAMEGQSEDCPDSPGRRGQSPRSRTPQWRGSRKTARTVRYTISSHVHDPAAMEGQSEDCPDPRRCYGHG